MKQVLIVSRHPAVAEFVRAELPARTNEELEFTVRAQVGPDDVRGQWVAGVLPFHLAALTARFWAVEFPADSAPRGNELSLEQMRAAGARLVEYTVRAVPGP